MARVLIRRAIEQGAPAYNAGQVERCMQIYQETSKELLLKHRQELSSSVATALEDGVQISMALFDAEKNEVNQLAWAFRRAFDEQLAAEDLAGGGGAKMLVAAAIRQGVPLYNSGNAQGCAEVYAETTRKLLNGAGGELSSSTKAVLQRAMESEPADPDARAWALRRALDAVAEASVDMPSGEKSSPGLVRDFVANQGFEIAAFVVNDTVMGGRSDSELLTSQGAVFCGTVTKRGGGGFASVRFQPRDRKAFLAMLRGAQGLSIKVRRFQGAIGWKLQLNSQQEKQWQQDFSLPGTEEEDVQIPFSSMWPTWRGRVVGSRGLTPRDLEDIQGFGLMLSFLSADGSNNKDFQEGPFELRLLSISTY